jgi:ankyrin repeat protein
MYFEKYIKYKAKFITLTQTQKETEATKKCNELIAETKGKRIDGTLLTKIFNNKTVLIEAIQKDLYDVAKFFITYYSANVNSYDGKKMTPLYKAVQKENIDFITFLLQNGADVNKLALEKYYP